MGMIANIAAWFRYRDGLRRDNDYMADALNAAAVHLERERRTHAERMAEVADFLSDYIDDMKDQPLTPVGERDLERAERLLKNIQPVVIREFPHDGIRNVWPAGYSTTG